MALKFRLKGLAETFVDNVCCPGCGYDGGPNGEKGFATERTKVTYDGIVVVLECEQCETIFVPYEQRHGIINVWALREAVEKDCNKNGQPLFPSRKAVELDVEKLNASKDTGVQ